MQKQNKYAGKGWYALRRTLPPWCWRENLQELVKYCSECKINEVIVKVDTEEFSHGIPTIEWLMEYQQALFEIKRRLNEVGVVFSLNPWVTLVHGDCGRNMKEKYPEMDFMVGHDGFLCTDCACPLSLSWREHTAKLWQIYAETEPDIIWVEDDIRTFNHYPVKFGCFCQKHLDLFSERVGKKVSREQLVDAILLPGSPHPYRVAWLDMQGEVMIEVAEALGKAVHSVSPGIQIGLMSSGPGNHCVEGRKWHSFSKAFSGETVPVSRPPLGNYSEQRLTGLYYTANSIRLTRYVMPENTIEMAEVENYPFSQYNKSNTYTFLQAAICFAMGTHGVTMNLFDHCGTAMNEDRAILESLATAKPYLNAISKKCCFQNGQFKGVRILHHDKCSYYKQLDQGDGYSDLGEQSFGWEDLLQSCGFGTTYDESNIVALSGQSIRCLEPTKIIELLSKGVLCDLTAAASLIEMGYGKYLGVDIGNIFRRGDLPIAAEHFYNGSYGGRNNHFFALTIFPTETMLAKLVLQSNTVEVSELVNIERERIGPGLTLYENSLGGKVAVWPVDINFVLLSRLAKPGRQTQLLHVLQWLSDDKIPLTVIGGHNTLAFKRDTQGKSIIGVFDLSLDSWEKTEITACMDKEIKKINMLDESGKWQPIDFFSFNNGKLHIEYNKELTFKTPLIFELIQHA